MTKIGKNARGPFVRFLILLVAVGLVASVAYWGSGTADPSSGSDVTRAFTVNETKEAPAQKTASGGKPDVGDTKTSGGVESSGETPAVRTAATARGEEAPAPYEIIEQPDMAAGDPEAGRTARHEEEHLTIPEGSSYVPDEVLVTVPDDATVEEVNALIAQTDSVVAREVSVEEIESGHIKLEVSEGASVEDAMNDLVDSGVIEGAQPNFIYYAMAGDENDLRELLDAALTPRAVEPENAAEEDDPAPTVEEGAAAIEEGDDAVVEDGSTLDETVVESGPEETPTDNDAVTQDDEGTPEQDDEKPELKALADELVKPNDPRLNSQWALASMHVYEAWALVKCEHAVGVAIIDQGPDPTHEDLVANVIDTYDTTTKSESISFANNHGTAVSGVVSAVADNEIGVAGVSYNADMMLINVMKRSSYGGLETTTNYLVDAFDYVIEKADEFNVRVINVSIGGALKNPIDSMVDGVLKDAIDRAYARGIVTVAAAGNEGSSYSDGTSATVPFYEYPGDFENVVSVINLQKSGTGAIRASDSNYNVDGQTAKNISAPGTGVLSTYTNNSYNSSLHGTSLAAPQVTGVLALEFAANPQMGADEAVQILYDTALESSEASGGLYDPTKSFEQNYTDFGWGEANAFEAVKAAKEKQDVEVPAPKVTGATHIPVGATASYTVEYGTIEIKSGGSYASLADNTLTGLEAGTVTLAVIDETGEERSTFTVIVYKTTGTWIIASKLDSTYVIDVQGASVANKGNAIIYQTNGKNNQVWLLEDEGEGTFVIRSGKSGKVLDVSGGSSSSGANVCQYALGDKAWQRWTMRVASDNSVIFVNKNSGKVLEVDDDYAANSKNVCQATETGAAQQRWYLRSVKADIGSVWDGVYRISSSINEDYVLEVQRRSKADGGNVDLYTWNGGANQRWNISYLGNGVYKILNVNSSRSLDVQGAKLAYSVNIDQWTWKNSGNQRWNLTEYTDGSYAIVRAGTTWVVDVKHAKAQNGTNVHQYARKNNNAQKWFLTQF